jgi:hypothetical protein
MVKFKRDSRNREHFKIYGDEVSPALEIGRMDQSSTTLSGLADVGSHQE